MALMALVKKIKVAMAMNVNVQMVILGLSKLTVIINLHGICIFCFYISCEIQIDSCRSNPCQNNATCINIADYFRCECTKDYVGEYCEREYNPCKNSPKCINGGSCVLYDFNSTRCICPSNYTGESCENLMSCDCKNNGTCNVESWTCECPPQWTGLDCSIDKNDCLSQPCLNDGTCIDIPAINGGGFTCTCSGKFSGRLCAADLSVNIYQIIREKCQNKSYSNLDLYL